MMQRLLIIALALLNLTGGLNHRAVDSIRFHITSRAEYVGSAELTYNTSLTSSTTEQSYLETATQLVQTIFPDATFRVVDDHYIGDNGVAHVYLRQTVHGIDIDNADFNVNVKAGKVFSYGHSFDTSKVPQVDHLLKRDLSDPVTALRSAVNILNLSITVDRALSEAQETNSYVFKGTAGAVSDPKAKLVYFIKPNDSFALTWRVETDINKNWFLAYVDANSNEIHGIVDYVAEVAETTSYEIYPWGLIDPTEGSRLVVNDPWDTSASPFTWIGDGTTTYATTRGNNAIAQSNPSGKDPYLDNFRPDSPNKQFVYPYSPSMSPPASYVNASIVQLFYTVNTYHDLLYLLGFTEKAGNFQWNNNGKGGREHDYVILDAQDGLGINGASFASPPDGQPGRMRVRLWTSSTPNRDGSFEADTVIHEYTHGLSSRLTGGPANSGCLNGREPGGMDEGWADFMAIAVGLKTADSRSKDYPRAAWASNNPRGVRRYLYSTRLNINPLTYVSVNQMIGVHEIGNVWATMLYEVLWNLIDKHGKNDNPKPVFRGLVPTDGRYLTMKLVIDGMALQPCNPTFVQARDAILDADIALTNGTNQCEIWKGFAKRGLGQGAKYGVWNRVDSTAVPSGICSNPA